MSVFVESETMVIRFQVKEIQSNVNEVLKMMKEMDVRKAMSGWILYIY